MFEVFKCCLCAGIYNLVHGVHEEKFINKPILSIKRGEKMSLTGWLGKIVRKMKWYDISLLKLTVFFATLFLITAWAGFRDLVLGFAWYWYLIIMVIFMIPLLKRMFFD